MADIYTETFSVISNDYASAGEASAKIKSILKMIGIDPALIRRVSISAYEAEMNMIIHSNGGIIKLEISPNNIQINCADTGPGIPDIDLAMQEGFSTAPSNVRTLGFGAGMGLSNIKKNSDTFNIQSNKEGTNLSLKFIINEKAKIL